MTQTPGATYRLQFNQGFLDRRKHAEIATTRTPVGINLAFQIGHRHLLGSCHRRHLLVSSNHDLVSRN